MSISKFLVLGGGELPLGLGGGVRIVYCLWARGSFELKGSPSNLPSRIIVHFHTASLLSSINCIIAKSQHPTTVIIIIIIIMTITIIGIIIIIIDQGSSSPSSSSSSSSSSSKNSQRPNLFFFSSSFYIISSSSSSSSSSFSNLETLLSSK